MAITEVGRDGEQAARSFYAIDGRRVRVKDLLDAQLLDPGAQLQFERPRKGEIHHATVLSNGRIRLEDGQEFTSPSTAAQTAAAMRSCDGWTAWEVVKEGVLLDSLRQDLLDVVTPAPESSALGMPEEAEPADEDETADGDPAATVADRHARLRELRDRTQDQPYRTSVRDLLKLWGAKARGANVVSTIDADLDNHSLVTSPDFRMVALDSVVAVYHSAPSEEDEIESDDVSGASDEVREIGLRIGTLPTAMSGLESVSPQCTIEEAVTKMLLNDYSQLAVIAGKKELRGAITWKSIAQARHRDPGAPVSDAIVRAHDVAYSRELIEVLPLLQDDDFVFVRDEHGLPKGIVTSTDVVAKYGQTATPFFLIGEIDQRLRQVLSRAFVIEDIVDALGQPDRAIRTFGDLTIGDYLRSFENPVIWDQLRWPLDRKSFVLRLDEIRVLRNDVMHFNIDGVDEAALGILRHFAKLLRIYGE